MRTRTKKAVRRIFDSLDVTVFAVCCDIATKLRNYFPTSLVD